MVKLRLVKLPLGKPATTISSPGDCIMSHAFCANTASWEEGADPMLGFGWRIGCDRRDGGGNEWRPPLLYQSCPRQTKLDGRGVGDRRRGWRSGRRKWGGLMEADQREQTKDEAGRREQRKGTKDQRRTWCRRRSRNARGVWWRTCYEVEEEMVGKREGWRWWRRHAGGSQARVDRGWQRRPRTGMAVAADPRCW
jgi:hypothetical protein